MQRYLPHLAIRFGLGLLLFQDLLLVIYLIDDDDFIHRHLSYHSALLYVILVT